MKIDIADLVVGVLIFVLSASDFYKGFLMVFKKDSYPFLSIAQLSFWMFKLLPVSVRQERYNVALGMYKKRRKVYGVFALVGGIWTMFWSFLVILGSLG